MPVTVLSERRRLPRMLKVRLGTKRTNQGGKQYPAETDHFVFERSSIDGVDPRFIDHERAMAKDVTALYGAAPKALRMMLPMEMDTQDPQSGDDLIMNVHQRAYGRNAGLKCKGTGLDPENPGVAETTDEGWAKRIGAATGRAPVKTGSRWAVTCWGRGCPKYAAGGDDAGENGADHDPDAACRTVGILRAFLLHPDPNPASPDYCRVLGVVEIATSSWNSIIDVQSGLAMLRAYSGGRTAGLPFTLARVPRHTYGGGRKALHFPMVVIPDPAEVGKFGMIPVSQVFLSPSVRAELIALNQAGAAVDFDSVRDLVAADRHPRLHAPDQPEPPEENLRENSRENSATASTDRAEALENAGVPELTPDDVPLSQAERDQLRTLVGDSATFRALATAAHAALGTDPTAPQPITRLQKRHANYIREQHRLRQDAATETGELPLEAPQ